MSDTVLTLAGITKTYHRGDAGEDLAVLKGVDLTLHAGEAVALMAPSGAGKSTLLHIAGLLDTADSGTVHLLGKNAGQGSDAARTRMRREEIGFVYQFHHLLPEFTAAENVVLPQLAAGVARADADARAAHLLSVMGLKDRMIHRPAALSGGEQQRVAIARALANRPRMLLADEPTGNLDPATADIVFDALMGLVRKEGLAALIATHNPDLAGRMDRVLRMEQGQLV